jgi:hypothetical protein
MIMSVVGERGVDTGKSFRCVAFFAHSKGEGRKERKKERSGTFRQTSICIM